MLETESYMAALRFMGMDCSLDQSGVVTVTMGQEATLNDMIVPEFKGTLSVHIPGLLRKVHTVYIPDRAEVNIYTYSLGVIEELRLPGVTKMCRVNTSLSHMAMSKLLLPERVTQGGISEIYLNNLPQGTMIDQSKYDVVSSNEFTLTSNYSCKKAIFACGSSTDISLFVARDLEELYFVSKSSTAFGKADISCCTCLKSILIEECITFDLKLLYTDPVVNLVEIDTYSPLLLGLRGVNGMVIVIRAAEGIIKKSRIHFELGLRGKIFRSSEKRLTKDIRLAENYVAKKKCPAVVWCIRAD